MNWKKVVLCIFITLFSLWGNLAFSQGIPWLDQDGLFLGHNKINPLNHESVSVVYHLAQDTHVVIKIYDLSGQKLIRTLVDGNFGGSWSYQVFWDGTSRSGDVVGNGIYVIQLVTKSVNILKFIAVVKTTGS